MLMEKVKLLKGSDLDNLRNRIQCNNTQILDNKTIFCTVNKPIRLSFITKLACISVDLTVK
jgi:hypothetical protein